MFSFWPLAVMTLLLAALLGLTFFSGARHDAVQPTLIVLGAAQYAGTPSPAFQRRLDHAAKLYHQGNVNTIVVTGGKRPGDRYSEGQVGLNYLLKSGVPRSALLAETRSRTTVENLRFAQRLLPQGSRLTIVTDKAHTPRALALARALGLHANANSSPLTYSPSLRYVMREKLALAAYALIGVSETHSHLN